ncbi:hypothetical protein [Azospirillum sp. TSO35-2]|uniref:hypothetical protein n=1 Tax=Azospirillum sp. TSO35-2 TaxID=716796 RepID=UPI000D61B150|nr:hypothetical protein [Azospirillum sp. TSO35-2]PWC31374.1 hypothetical protein TSO352_31910 [Azospirillum sp. TSO35-2]
MAEANVNDRSSVERMYDKDTFEQDAAWNARGKATILRGVKILSAPDDEGRIELSRASQHAGEGNLEGDSVFVPAYKVQDALSTDGNAYSSSVEPVSPKGGPGQGGTADAYRAFIDQILQAAQTGPFKSDIGLDEDRLKGFHGG